MQQEYETMLNRIAHCYCHLSKEEARGERIFRCEFAQKPEIRSV